MNQTFNDELKALIALVRFKKYKRDGCVLYAKYDIYKPECTVSELVWGFCRNPCYARKLVRELLANIPDYPEILSKSTQMIQRDTIYPSFDAAMVQLCKKKDAPQIVFSTESTNIRDGFYIDEDNRVVQSHNASDDDGETWHGFLVTPEWAKSVSNVSVGLFTQCEGWSDTMIWQHSYGPASIAKRVKNIDNGLCLFQPLKHPLPLLNLNLRVGVQITYKASVTTTETFEPPRQVFGILSNDFSNWLVESSIQLKLFKNETAKINMQDETIDVCK